MVSTTVEERDLLHNIKGMESMKRCRKRPLLKYKKGEDLDDDHVGGRRFMRCGFKHHQTEIMRRGLHESSDRTLEDGIKGIRGNSSRGWMKIITSSWWRWSFQIASHHLIPSDLNHPRLLSSSLPRDNCRIYLKGWIEDRNFSSILLFFSLLN